MQPPVLHRGRPAIPVGPCPARSLFELVLLQRPVFNGIALGLGERDKATAGLRAMHDVDGAVRELGRDISHRGVFAGGKHPNTWNQDHPWVRSRLLCFRPSLVFSSWYTEKKEPWIMNRVGELVSPGVSTPLPLLIPACSTSQTRLLLSQMSQMSQMSQTLLIEKIAARI